MPYDVASTNGVIWLPKTYELQNGHGVQTKYYVYIYGIQLYQVGGWMCFEYFDELNVMWFCGSIEWKHLGDSEIMKGATAKKVVLKHFEEQSLIGLSANFQL